jgi:hypothetical protein
MKKQMARHGNMLACFMFRRSGSANRHTNVAVADQQKKNPVIPHSARANLILFNS